MLCYLFLFFSSFFNANSNANAMLEFASIYEDIFSSLSHFLRWKVSFFAFEFAYGVSFCIFYLRWKGLVFELKIASEGVLFCINFSYVVLLIASKNASILSKNY